MLAEGEKESNCEINWKVNSRRKHFQQLRVGAKVRREGSLVLAERALSPLSSDRLFSFFFFFLPQRTKQRK